MFDIKATDIRLLKLLTDGTRFCESLATGLVCCEWCNLLKAPCLLPFRPSLRRIVAVDPYIGPSKTADRHQLSDVRLVFSGGVQLPRDSLGGQARLSESHGFFYSMQLLDRPSARRRGVRRLLCHDGEGVDDAKDICESLGLAKTQTQNDGARYSRGDPAKVAADMHISSESSFIVERAADMHIS